MQTRNDIDVDRDALERLLQSQLSYRAGTVDCLIHHQCCCHELGLHRLLGRKPLHARLEAH